EYELRTIQRSQSNGGGRAFLTQPLSLQKPSEPLKPELGAQGEAVHPEQALLERESRLSTGTGAEVRGRGNQAGAERAVDLVPRPDHVRPQKERIARLEPEPFADIHARVEPKLGQQAEDGASVVSDVGRKSQDAAGCGLAAQRRGLDCREALDID